MTKTITIPCRKVGAIGKFYEKEFTIDIREGEEVLYAWSRQYGNEWEFYLVVKQ